VSGRTFACSGCGAPGVRGIYCDRCRAARRTAAVDLSRVVAGAFARFLWRGVWRDGTIVSVGRTHAEVIVEVAGKRRTLRVGVTNLYDANDAPLVPPLVIERLERLEQGEPR